MYIIEELVKEALCYRFGCRKTKILVFYAIGLVVGKRKY